MSTITEPSAWYTTQFITNSLKDYLENEGFRLNEPDEEQAIQTDKTIVATKLLSKEIIEVRGTVDEKVKPSIEGEGAKRGNLFMEAVNFVSVALLLPINFLSSQSSDEKNYCFCLPDLEQYRSLLTKVEEYFMSNQLRLKIYLVNQNGAVQTHCLNPTEREQAS